MGGGCPFNKDCYVRPSPVLMVLNIADCLLLPLITSMNSQGSVSVSETFMKFLSFS